MNKPDTPEQAAERAAWKAKTIAEEAPYWNAVSELLSACENMAETSKP